jgi:hypothetical protein
MTKLETLRASVAAYDVWLASRDPYKTADETEQASLASQVIKDARCLVEAACLDSQGRTP